MKPKKRRMKKKRRGINVKSQDHRAIFELIIPFMDIQCFTIKFRLLCHQSNKMYKHELYNHLFEHVRSQNKLIQIFYYSKLHWMFKFKTVVINIPKKPKLFWIKSYIRYFCSPQFMKQYTHSTCAFIVWATPNQYKEVFTLLTEEFNLIQVTIFANWDKNLTPENALYYKTGIVKTLFGSKLNPKKIKYCSTRWEINKDQGRRKYTSQYILTENAWLFRRGNIRKEYTELGRLAANGNSKGELGTKSYANIIEAPHESIPEQKPLKFYKLVEKVLPYAKPRVYLGGGYASYKNFPKLYEHPRLRAKWGSKRWVERDKQWIQF